MFYGYIKDKFRYRHSRRGICRGIRKEGYRMKAERMTIGSSIRFIMALFVMMWMVRKSG